MITKFSSLTVLGETFTSVSSRSDRSSYIQILFDGPEGYEDDGKMIDAYGVNPVLHPAQVWYRLY